MTARLRTVLAVAAIAVLATAPAAAGSKTGIGVHVPGAPADLGNLDRYVQQAGREPALLSWYSYWGDPLIYESDLRRVSDRGAVPLISWEPWRNDGTGFGLAGIADGANDAYVRESARAAAAWGKPILLRFAHEMNGDWYPWGAGDNDPADYVRAWRHVVSIFREEGAGNVRFVWSPNAEDGGTEPIDPYYPGDRWVDWAGLDGFNWGGDWGWRSFSEIFGASYEKLTALTDAPILIGETGSNDEPGDKAAWIASTYGTELPRFGRVRAIVYYNSTFADRADFRLESPPDAFDAYRAAIAAPRYRVDGEGMLAAAETRERHGGGGGSGGAGQAQIPVPGGGFGQPSLPERVREELRGKEIWIGLAGLLVVAAGVAAGFFLRRAHRVRRG